MGSFDEIYEGILLDPVVATAEAPRVMVVDDNQEIADAIRLTLDGRYHVVVCRSLQEALDRLDAGNPDLVLLDIQMAVHDGIECFHRFRARRPGLKIVFHTAYAGSAEKARLAEGLDHDGFLYKGEYSGRTLTETIEAALQGDGEVAPTVH